MSADAPTPLQLTSQPSRAGPDEGRDGAGSEEDHTLEDQKLFLTQLVTLIAVLDPVGHLTLFLTTTSSLDRHERRTAAIRALPIALVVPTAFAVGGQYILRAMGISLLSFQVAGGIILFLFSLTMVLGPAEQAEESLPEGHGAALGTRARTLAVYPLAVPIIAGRASSSR